MSTAFDDEEELECEHNDTHIETVDYGYVSYEKQDWVDDMRRVDVCDTCGMVFDYDPLEGVD